MEGGIAFGAKLLAIGCKRIEIIVKQKRTNIEMKNFKQLRVWQTGMEFTKLLYKFTEQLPQHEKSGLTSQINRAAVSIPTNIAEGSSRKSQKDYFRFLEIALGSAFELESLLLVVISIEYATESLSKDLLELISSEQKMLMTFMEVL